MAPGRDIHAHLSVSVATYFRNAAVKNRSHRHGMAQTMAVKVSAADRVSLPPTVSSQSVIGNSNINTRITKLMPDESSLSGICIIGAITDFHHLVRLGAGNRHYLIILFHPQFLSTNHSHRDCYSPLQLHLLAYLLHNCKPSHTKTKHTQNLNDNKWQ
jgi:hypothetical protein